MRQRGFSLVELMVALAILVLLLLAALPGLATWLDNTRIRNSADSLQNGLQQARSEAVRRNQSVSFWLVSVSDPAVLSNDCLLSDTSGSWIVSVIKPIGHCADAPSTISSPMIVTGRPAGDGGGRVAITAFQADGTTAGTTVTFNGFGRVANSDAIGQINVTSSNGGGNYRKLRIAITPAGLVRMCDPAVSSANDPRQC